MANGAYNDPYIVSSWAEFLTYNTSEYIGEYVKFNVNIDFSLIYPNGSSGGLVIYPNIMGNDRHWSRLAIISRTASTIAVEFKGTVENLYIDALYAKVVGGLIMSTDDIVGLHMTAQIDNNGATYIFGSYSLSDEINLIDSEIDIRVRTNGQIYFHNPSITAKLKNTSVNLNWQCPMNPVNITNVEMDASMFTGNITTGGTATIAICQKSPYENTQSLWDVKTSARQVFCQQVYGSSDQCYYNTDKTTFSGDTLDWIGLTTEQLADETELESAGFPIGGDSPWILELGKIENNSWTGYRNNKLGAFNVCVGLYNVQIPISLQSIGRHSFQINTIPSVTLPNDCTYYSTSFRPGMTIEGGILIE